MSSYRQIIKSTGIVSIGQFVVMLLGIVRTKVMAIYVGPAGVGLLGLYLSIAETIGALAQFGVGTSGVRQVANAVGNEDKTYAAKCIFVLRRVVLLTSTLGALLCLIFSKYISQIVFGTQDKMWGVALVSVIVLFNGISFGQKIILTGYREIRSLALCQIIGGILGTISTCLLIYFLREDGIIFTLVMVAFFGILTSWWYAKKIKLEKVDVSKNDALLELKELLELGIAFSIASLFSAAANYIIRIYIRSQLGIEGVGIYQAGWAISNLYVGMILGAMSVDFLPRISQQAKDNHKINRLVNDQMELGMLIGTMGVLAGIIFAPALLHILYSDKFLIGENMVRWQFIGVGLRVLGWPMSYVLVAKGKGVIYVLVQASFFIANILFLVITINLWGFKGLGIDYCLSYIGYLLLVAYVCRRLTGFICSPLLLRVMLISFAMQTVCAMASFFLPTIWSIPLGTLLLIFCIIWSAQIFKRDMGVDIWNWLLHKFVGRSNA